METFMSPYLVATAIFLLAGRAALAGPEGNPHEQHEHAAHEHHHDHHETFAAGQPGDPAKPARQVKIVMMETADSMVFVPAKVDVSQGEQIAFVLENEGELEHEFVLGTREDNQEHEQAMEEMPGMEHEEANETELDPGETKTFVWRFTNPGTFEYACLIPGHYEAGMHGTIQVK
jgi:uncharacterized cupredoxin-like copper-binding protein